MRTEGTRDQHRIITEALTITEQEGGRSQITATLARGNIINRNRRYYSATVLERAANASRDRIEAGKLIGLMDHPNFWNGEGDRGKPERTVIRWNRLYMNGADLKGEGTIVETALGRDLKAMDAAKVHIGLSTNAYASAHFENAEDVPAPYDGDPNDLIQVIDEIEELLTIDVVNDPSNVYAQIEQEARQQRVAYQEERRSMDEADTNVHETDEAQNDATEATEATEAEVTPEADQEPDLATQLEEARAALHRERRSSIVREEIARRGTVRDAVAKAAMLVALASESDEDATEAVRELLDGVKGENGNNAIPTREGQRTADPLREMRSRFRQLN